MSTRSTPFQPWLLVARPTAHDCAFRWQAERARKAAEEVASAPPPALSSPHLHRDRAHPYHICAGTGLSRGTRVSTPSTPVSTLRPLRFQTAHAQRHPCE